MTSKQSFTLLLLVAVSLYTPADSVLCRNMSVSPAHWNDPEVRHEEMGNLLTNFLRSPYAPPRSELGEEVVQYILDLYNGTDSPLLRAQLQAFAHLSPVLLVWGNPTIGDLCGPAKGLNATALYVRELNNRIILPVIDRLSGIFERNCKKLTRLILKQMGCHKFPVIDPYKGPSCEDAGHTFDYLDIVNVYGRYLPCRFRNYILRLYETSKLEDKVFAASLTLALTRTENAVSSLYPIQNLFEVMRTLTEPREKVCCCKARRERLEQLCDDLGDTNADPLKDLLTTECPPEAPYQK